MERTTKDQKTIYIQYYALFREESGRNTETVKTQARTPLQLYAQLKKRYGFSLETDASRVAVNGCFKPWSSILKKNDTVAFIPPFAGG